MKKPRKENRYKKKKQVINSPDDVIVPNDTYYVVRGSLEETTILIDMLKKQCYNIDSEFSLDNMKEHIPIGICIKNGKGRSVFGITGTFLYLYSQNYTKYGINPILGCKDVIEHFEELIIKKDSKFFNELIKKENSYK